MEKLLRLLCPNHFQALAAAHKATINNGVQVFILMGSYLACVLTNAIAGRVVFILIRSCPHSALHLKTQGRWEHLPVTQEKILPITDLTFCFAFGPGLTVQHKLASASW